MPLKTFLLFVILGGLPLSALTQSTGSQAPAQNSSDQQHHLAAEDFVASIKMKEAISNAKENSVELGKQEMLRSYPNYSAAFAEEWKQRMLARFPLADYVSVAVATYEKHFTTEELRQLSAAISAPGGLPAASITPTLREKISTDMVSIQSEIIGGCAQVGSKLGAEIGMEIMKEHPEWVKTQ